MFKHRYFEVDVRREVSPGELRWPNDEECEDDSGLGCNREYLDYRGLSWAEAQEVHDSESKLVSRLETADDPDQTYEEIDEESYVEPNGLMGLDIGVASLVAALSAAGCIPCASCNGGAFGGNHHEEHPVVAFFARKEAIAPLMACAEHAGCGFVSDDAGALIMYAADILRMRSLAKMIIERHQEFDRTCDNDDVQSRLTDAQPDLFR